MSDRTSKTIKNIYVGYISNVVSLLVNFIYRTLFLRYLGLEYLGVNGLFYNVLGLLSFTELGIGTVLNYNLYKPVAEGDIEKIKTVMAVYKKCYVLISVVILSSGLALFPFLSYLVKDPGNVGNINIYYLVFLFNSAISYLFTYKYSLLNAEQNSYIMTGIDTVSNVIVFIARTVIIVKTRNYLLSLFTESIFIVVKMFIVNAFLNRRYPYLLQKDIAKMSSEQKKDIKKNVVGLVWHKLGDVLINSTDNIIISAFISLKTVGLMANYTIIKNAVDGFVKKIFFGTIPSFGNLVATTEIEKQYSVFRVYNFLSFWIYGFCSVSFYILASPFICIWLGDDMLINDITWLIICLDYYLLGQRIAFQNYKTAFGIFYDDQYVVIVSFLVNLVVSVFGAIKLGILGVYIGTILSGIYQSIRRPMIAFTRITGDKTSKYFSMLLRYLGLVVFVGILLKIISYYVIGHLTIIRFLIMSLIVFVVPNIVFYAFYRKSEEFNYLKAILINRISMRKSKSRKSA